MSIKYLFRHRLAKISFIYYLVVVAWWLKIFLSGREVGFENYFFNFSYLFFNLAGGIGGFVIARKWGGLKSRVGKGLSFLGLGLLSQGFGLVVWTFYNIVLQVEIPYPSLADIGYFLLIPCYIYAMYNLALASGVQVNLRTVSGKIQALAIPFFMLLIAYALYLKGLPVDLTEPIRTFLDWGTPAFNAVSVSIAILTYSLSVGVLGGKMKKKVLFLAFALICEYITEYSFLYRAGLELYYNAGPVDLMFATSAFIMTLGILQFYVLKEE